MWDRQRRGGPVGARVTIDLSGGPCGLARVAVYPPGGPSPRCAA